MEAAKFPCYYFATALPLRPNTSLRRSFFQCKRLLGMRIKAARRESNERDYWGRLVDEDMITLRMRIREAKMMQKTDGGDDQRLRSDWKEWEQKHLLYYNKTVYEVVGLLQNHLLNTRPTLALGMVALVALSVPISISILFFSAFEIAKGISPPGFHF